MNDRVFGIAALGCETGPLGLFAEVFPAFFAVIAVHAGPVEPGDAHAVVDAVF